MRAGHGTVVRMSLDNETRKALGDLAGLCTQPGRSLTLQPENAEAEPASTAHDSLKVDQ